MTLLGTRTRGAAIAIVAIVTALAASYATQAAGAKPKHHYPSGTVKLPKSRIKHVGKVLCGKPGAKWVSGTLVAPHWFLSDSRQQKNYLKLAHKARGRAKQKDLKRARFYGRRAKAHQSVCKPKPKPTPGSPLPSMGPEPAPSIFGIDTSTFDSNQTDFTTDFPTSQSLGARWDRFTAGAAAGAGNYSGLDYDVTQARKHGMGVTISLGGIASACSTSTSDVSACMPSTAADLSNYQAHMKTLILRYQNVVEYYESWVEPNNPPAGAANPQQYATLLKAQYAEIQSLNSQYGLHIKLLLGSPIGFGNSADSKPLVFPWIDQVLTDLDGQRAFDGAALHAYRLGSQVYGPNDPAPDYVGSLTYPDYGCRLPSDGVCEMTWSQELSAYEQEFINHGYGTTPLWLTEFGWPGEANPGNSPYDLDEAQQNTDLQEAYADLLKLPFVQGAFWFNLRNYQPGYATTDPEYFFYMGLLEYDYTKKPAATSFSALAAANPDR